MLDSWLKKNPLDRLPERLRQWAWFIALWLSGFLSVALLSYSVKWLLKI